MTDRPRIGRRGALLLPVVLGGCSLVEDWFSDVKPPLAGDREAVSATGSGMLVAEPGSAGALSLPAPAAKADWPQVGGDPAHAGGQLQLGGLRPLWHADIGEGGGYRDKLTGQPVVAGEHVFTIDSDGGVAAFDAANGRRAWHTDTTPPHNRSTNLGGGLAWAGGRLYASTGRAELLCLDPADGQIAWRKSLGAPARSAPTLADGKAFVTSLDDRISAFDARGGDQLWSYQAQTASTGVLAGAAAPACADGLVVAGFGSGDLLALRAATGGVVWSDSLASVRSRDSMIDPSSVRGAPVIARGRVYAVGLGGLMVSLDLRSGRRLWERPVSSGDTPWLAGDWLFLVSTNQQLAAVSALDGKVRWVADLPRYEKPAKLRGAIFWRGPVLAGGKLLLVGSSDRLLAADPQTGKILAGLDLPDSAPLAPIVAGGVAYVLTDDGTLSAFG